MSKNTRSKIGRRQFVSTTTAGIVGAGAALGARVAVARRHRIVIARASRARTIASASR